MNRRRFLQTTSTSIGALSLGLMGCAETTEAPVETPATPSAVIAPLGVLGVQLYTLRSLLADDLEGTLRQVAEIGYRQVEFAGYYDRDPQDLRAFLDDLGLAAPSAHVPLNVFEAGAGDALEAAQVMGHQTLVLPWVDRNVYASVADYQRLAEQCNRFGEACQAAGVRFAYHNHDFEFDTVEGQVLYDVLVQNTEPGLVDLELDLCWIVAAGYDPLEYLNRYPDRFTMYHVKDLNAEGGPATVGTGSVDFPAVFEGDEAVDIRYYYVEHDNPADPMASIQASYAYLRALEA
ncbi:MAG: sugar phosphate isomerase/epimerase [Bacteroidota bacterium]